MAPGMTTQREADIMELEAEIVAAQLISEFTLDWFGDRGIPDEHAQDVQPAQDGTNG